MNRPLSYWHAGGDIICRGGHPVSFQMSRELLAILTDEYRAADKAGAYAEAERIGQAAMDLINARVNARRWGHAMDRRAA